MTCATEALLLTVGKTKPSYSPVIFSNCLFIHSASLFSLTKPAFNVPVYRAAMNMALLGCPLSGSTEMGRFHALETTLLRDRATLGW